MEGNEHEREETQKFKENRPENYHVHDSGQSTSIILETLDSSPLGLSSAKVIDEDVSAVTPVGPQPVDDGKIATDNLPSESSIADSEQVVEEGSTDDADERQDEEAANGGADVVAVNQPVAAPSPDQIFAEVVG